MDAGGVLDEERINLPRSVPYVERSLNWVRVAQRFPVRVRLANPPPLLMRLGASAVFQRKLADPDEDVNDWDLEYFPKLKWMRRRTHERLVERGLELVERRDAVWMEAATRLLNRLGWPGGRKG